MRLAAGTAMRDEMAASSPGISLCPGGGRGWRRSKPTLGGLFARLPPSAGRRVPIGQGNEHSHGHSRRNQGGKKA